MAIYKEASLAQCLLGLIALAMGLATLLLGGLIGYALVSRMVGSPGEGLITLAIFFSLLSGLGILAAVAGFNLLFAGRSTSKAQLVPWQPLVVSGALILTSMLGFLGYTIWLGQPVMGAGAKGTSLLLGLGLAFLLSGLYRRKQQPRTLFK